MTKRLEELGRDHWSDHPSQMTASEGHPQSKWTPELAERVLELTEQGKTVRQCAAAIDVHIDTLYRWIERNAEFHAQVKEARKRAGGPSGAGVSKYTPEAHDLIVAALAIGATQAAAAALVGIHRHTLASWLDPDDAHYIEELDQAVSEAKARELIENLRMIREAAQLKRTWQAAAWLNERLYPESFALGRAREVTAGTAENPIHTTNAFVEEAARMIKQQRDELATRRLKELGVEIDDDEEERGWQPPQLPSD